MGAKPDDIARDIRQQRAEITSKLDHLTARLRDDAGNAQGAVNERLPDLGGVEHRVRSHPLTSLSAAFGAGAALGMLSDMGGGSDSSQGEGRRGQQDGRSQGGQQGSSMLTSMLGSAMGPATGVLQRRIRAFVEEATASFSQEDQRQSQNGHAEERYPAESRR